MQKPSYEVPLRGKKKCACQAGDIVRCDPVTDRRPKSSFFSGKNNKKGSKWTITGSLTEFVRIRFNYASLSTCTVQMNQGRADAVTKRIPVVTVLQNGSFQRPRHTASITIGFFFPCASMLRHERAICHLRMRSPITAQTTCVGFPRKLKTSQTLASSIDEAGFS